MKILIPTIGTRGDVRPFIALAQGLNRAGHTVSLASHPILGNLVQTFGVAFAPFGADIKSSVNPGSFRPSPNY